MRAVARMIERDLRQRPPQLTLREIMISASSTDSFIDVHAVISKRQIVEEPADTMSAITGPDGLAPRPEPA